MKYKNYIKNILIASVLLLTVFLTTSCSIGPDSYKEPWEINPDFRYCVVYDAMGGKINTLSSRTVWYAGDSLIKEPNGSNGMLTKPVYDGMAVLGWYTAYKEVDKDGKKTFEFDEKDRWDFAKNRINDSTTDENKTLHLYARWINPPTIYFVDADNTDDVFFKWADVDVEKTISRPTTTERSTIEKNGKTYTLLDYYFDKDCTQKVTWGEGSKTVNEIIEAQEGKSAIYIYCKYIEGEYTRIRSTTELKAITDFAGKYILANDIDMKDTTWTPLTNKSEDPFTGVLLGNGYTIKNINIQATNRVNGLEAKNAKEKSYGLFTELKNAKISGLNFKDATITIGDSTNVKLCTGVYAGRSTKTVLENCKIDGLKVISKSQIEVAISLSSALFSDGTCTFTDCEFPFPDVSGLKIDQELLIIGE